MNALNKFFALCLASSTAMVAMEGAIAQYTETNDLSTTPVSGAALLGPTENSPWEWNVGMGGEYPDLSIKAAPRNTVSFQTAFALFSGQNTTNIPTFNQTDQWSVNSGNAPLPRTPSGVINQTNQWSVNPGNARALYLRDQDQLQLLQIMFRF